LFRRTTAGGAIDEPEREIPLKVDKYLFPCEIPWTFLFGHRTTPERVVAGRPEGRPATKEALAALP
jgi:hypothetical protein